MTQRERLLTQWLRDFLDDAMSAADDIRFLRRATSAKKMLQRQLDKEASK